MSADPSLAIVTKVLTELENIRKDYNSLLEENKKLTQQIIELSKRPIQLETPQSLSNLRELIDNAESTELRQNTNKDIDTCSNLILQFAKLNNFK